MTKLFDIKIQVKNTMVDALFASESHANLIANNLGNKQCNIHEERKPIMFDQGWEVFHHQRAQRYIKYFSRK
jgi:hypothetical protein